MWAFNIMLWVQNGKQCNFKQVHLAVFLYQFAILHRTSVSFKRVLQWTSLGLHISNYAVFLLPFLIQVQK